MDVPRIWITIPLELGERENLDLPSDYGCKQAEEVRAKL